MSDDLYPTHFLSDFRNLFGYQLYRLYKDRNFCMDAMFHELVDEHAGFQVIHDLLSSKKFDALLDIYRQRIDMNACESRILLSPEDKDYSDVMDIFMRDNLKGILKRKPSIEFERIHIKNKDVKDHNKRWHPDRNVDCYKMFYFINDHTHENGTYEYSMGSHNMSFFRYLWEYYTSIRFILARFSAGKFEKYPILLGKFIAEIIHTKVIMEHPQNTLIISNNKGFHRRGTLNPNTVREQVNFVFYNR
jgi:hypothetical protein